MDAELGMTTTGEDDAAMGALVAAPDGVLTMMGGMDTAVDESNDEAAGAAIPEG